MLNMSDKDSNHEADPKEHDIVAPESQVADSSSGEVDAAWKYLDGHRDAAAVDAVDINALRRRIDWHIVPLMFLCYTLQFLDKVILNVRIRPVVPVPSLLHVPHLCRRPCQIHIP